MTYFSEREHGERSRDIEDISNVAWGGLQSLIGARVEDGSFGASFAVPCPDGRGPIGTDGESLWLAMRAEVPALPERPWSYSTPVPATIHVLDLIEFCWRHVGKPDPVSYHPYFEHRHLRFDIDAGRHSFREDINRIFRRNGLAYELTLEGRVERLVPPMLREELRIVSFKTGDSELDRLLDTARLKFHDPDIVVRREALEALWDAWERLKTFGGKDKRTQIKKNISTICGSHSPKLCDALDREARELTALGNTLMIRHSEMHQEKVTQGEHIDYLFHRLFSFIWLIIRSNSAALSSSS